MSSVEQRSNADGVASMEADAGAPSSRASLVLRTAKWWLPTASMTALSLLSYVDRSVLAILIPSIERDTGLTDSQYSWAISAFSAAYFLGNPTWGRALDRYGVRIGLTFAVAMWTAASAVHGLVATALAFAVARAALGFGEGATFPGGLRTAVQTLAPDQRARGVGLAYSGGSLGAIVTPLLVTPIALRWGWRAAFYLTGLLGVAWLVLWAFVSRDERLRVEARSPEPRTLRRPEAWGFMAAYAFGGLPLGFVLYEAPLYLGHALGCDQRLLGRVLWLPPLGWEIGYFVWGWIVDRAARRGRLDHAFFARLFALLSLLALPLAGATLTSSRAVVLALFVFATFVASGFVILSLAETTRRLGTGQSAYLAGLGAGSWSALMAIVMPVFGRLFQAHAYGRAHVIAAVAPAIGWLAWRALAGRGRALHALGRA